MKKPVCVECQKEMKVQHTGATVLEMYLDPPEPYLAWSADIMVCPSCGYTVVSQWANKPFWRTGEPDPPDPEEVDVVVY